jgi:LysM repeat protein
MKFNKMLRLAGLVGAFTLAVGCAGPAEKSEADAKSEAMNAEILRKAAMNAAEMEAAAKTASAAAKTSTYEVNKGDHLWGIAGKESVYGNPYNWPLIYKANSDKIKDADLIHPGQVLDIKSNPSDAETAAAVHHAKTRGSWSIGVSEASDKAYLAQ